MSKLSLTEATMLALQGKLPMKENKITKRTKKLKKENIDINVDDKTSVSVMDTGTVVDTESATIIVDKKDEMDTVEVPVTSDDTIIPEDLPETDDMTSDILPTDDTTPMVEPNAEPESVTPNDDIDLPLDSNVEESKQTKLENKKLQEEVSNEAYEVAEAIANDFKGKEIVSWNEFNSSLEKHMKDLNLSAEYFNEKLSDFENDVRGILSMQYGFATEFEGENEGGLTTKFESVEIEVSNDGTEVEVTTDNGEEVEVKDETPDEDEITDEIDTEIDQNEENIENIENIEENKKLQEDIEAAPFRNMILQSLQDDIDDPIEIVERLAKAMSDDDCKWYCETYELVEPLENATNDKYYKDLWGNIRDISGQVVEDDTELEEAKHRKIESMKKIEKRITKHKKVETRSFLNANKKVERNQITKCDLKSFNEALSKTMLKYNKKIETVELNKAVKINDKLKMEAKVTLNDKTTKNICLEMKQLDNNNKFTRYNLINENKQNNLNLTMLTYTNKNNILECRYINKI